MERDGNLYNYIRASWSSARRNESFGPEAVRASEAGALRCSPVRHANLSPLMSVGATKNGHHSNATEAKTRGEPQNPFNCLFCCLLHEMKEEYWK